MALPALVDIAPDESGAAFGDAVHQGEIVGEIRHARVVEIVSNATEVQLRKMMIGWLLHGFCSVAGMRDEFAPSHRLPGDLRYRSGQKTRTLEKWPAIDPWLV